MCPSLRPDTFRPHDLAFLLALAEERSPGHTLAYNGTGMPERVLTYAKGGLRGDTFTATPEGAGPSATGSWTTMGRSSTTSTAARLELVVMSRSTMGPPHNPNDGIRPSDAYLQEWNSVKEMAKREDRMLERLEMMEARLATRHR